MQHEDLVQTGSRDPMLVITMWKPRGCEIKLNNFHIFISTKLYSNNRSLSKCYLKLEIDIILLLKDIFSDIPS